MILQPVLCYIKPALYQPALRGQFGKISQLFLIQFLDPLLDILLVRYVHKHTVKILFPIFSGKQLRFDGNPFDLAIFAYQTVFILDGIAVLQLGPEFFLHDHQVFRVDDS